MFFIVNRLFIAYGFSVNKMLLGAVQSKENKRQTKRRGENYWHVPRSSWVRSNSESFNDGLPKTSRRADFQRNWRGNKRNIRPKERLVIAERKTFLETRQWPDESIVQFVHRLKERARYCEFERLGTGEMTTEDELIVQRLIENKLLETLQSVNLKVETCIEFVQQLELIKKSITNNGTKEKPTAQTNTKFYVNTMANGMSGKK